MFERTKSGQQNRATFLGADYVCYVEGGGGGDTYAPDVTFWGQVFAITRPDIRVRCVPRGGKPELEALARNIIDKDISKTIVALDSDYDDYIGDKIHDRRVIYNLGYSWENDAYCIDNLHFSYKAICHCENVDEQISQFINTGIYTFISSMFWPVQADYRAFRGGSSVLSAVSPGRLVAVNNTTGLPETRRAEVLKLCREANAKTKTRSKDRRAIVDHKSFCQGHIYALAAYYIIKASIKKFYKKTSMSSDHLRDICLQTFSIVLDGDGHVARHYRSVMAQI